MDGAHEQVNTQRAHARDVDAGVWPSLPLRESEQTNALIKADAHISTTPMPPLKARFCNE
jgi:hypothetical protein